MSDSYEMIIGDLRDHLEEAEEENKKLKLAVKELVKSNEFYGDTENWWWQPGDSNKTACVIDDVDICYSDWSDGCAGAKARETAKNKYVIKALYILDSEK